MIRQLRSVSLGVLAAICASAASAQVGPPAPGPRCLPGSYDGGQMEMAAGLNLGKDHRFRYVLSYGALDEGAEGQWESDGAGNVLLTSDATKAPAFVMVQEVSSTPGLLQIALDVPTGISRQYFSAIIRYADGRSIVREFTEDGLAIELKPDAKPVSATLLLSVLEVESEAFALTVQGGSEVQVRFEPNDLGRVVFAKTPLKIDQDDLLLERHGRLIRFRRAPDGC